MLMIWRPPVITRTAPLFPSTTLFRSAMRRGERKKRKPRTISDKDKMYTRDIGPRIGSKVLAQLTEDDCWDAVYDKAKASKHRANKMAGELSRSEEHTSELQSLMRISNAVFCL